MKLDIITKEGKKDNIDLPIQFNEPIRADIIKRAFEYEQSIGRQPYGAKPEAGLRHSTYLSKRRHDYKSTYGIGQSRTPRKVLSRSGSRMNYVGAFAPQTVGGRRAHPPKADKIWIKKINKKELQLAIRSAITATVSKDLPAIRGHKVPSSYPFIIDESITNLKKTKEVSDFLVSQGFTDELIRVKEKKIRAGKGKMRGRKYKKKIGPLFVVDSECALLKSASAIPGVDISIVDDLNIEMLAPGAVPGRVTLWSKKSIEKMKENKMFI